jgi:hypothetical protein
MSTYTDEPRVEIYYYLNNERHAYRTRYHVPRAGDEVRLNTGVYRVYRVVWVDDDTPYHVAIELEWIAEKP